MNLTPANPFVNNHISKQLCNLTLCYNPAMDYSPRENTIVEGIIKYIRKLPRAHAEKVHGNSFSSGQPDIDAVIAGKSVKLEVKRPGEDATPLQKRRLEQWAKAGAVTGVVHSTGEVEKILKDFGLIR